MPEQAEKNAKEALAVGLEARIREWMCANLELCTIEQASIHADVEGKMAMTFGTTNASVLAAAGLGHNKDNWKKRKPGGPEPAGTKRNQTEPNGTKRNQTEPNGTKRNQMEPNGTKWNQNEPNGTKRTPTEPN